MLGLLIGVLPAMAGQVTAKKVKPVKASEYVVLASEKVRGEAAWNAVAEALGRKHKAPVEYYREAPGELLELLKGYRPRYVAIVEMPEALNRDWIIAMHQLSRRVDDDIFADFLWGVITGYDAAAAMKMVDNSTEPLTIRNTAATITELNSAKWFDRYGWVDDHKVGLWGEKRGPAEAVTTGEIPREQVLRQFTRLYGEIDPDLVVTAAHATERNLEMPFSLGNIKAREGKLYAEDRFTGETWELRESGKRKVYFAVGNCLIGNVNNTRESMAVAWMNSANAATMIGYVVETWHGRNGWGGLKYWLTTPGRYTLAEAVYLNQQDFLYQQSRWNPVFVEEDYPRSYGGGMMRAGARLAEVLGKAPSKDMLGFWHDRDVLAYYGDPKWEVRLQEIPGENDYTVTVTKKKKQYIVTIETAPHFNLKRLAGDGFKEEHVLDIPFSCFFPERLNAPRVAAGQPWKAVVDENFLLIYDPGFEAGKTYTIVLDVSK